MEKHLPPIEVMPDVTTPVIDLEVDLAKEEEKMRKAIQQLEESIKELPPS